MRFVALYGGPLDGACVPATPIEAYVRQGVTRILFRERRPGGAAGLYQLVHGRWTFDSRTPLPD